MIDPGIKSLKKVVFFVPALALAAAVAWAAYAQSTPPSARPQSAWSPRSSQRATPEPQVKESATAGSVQHVFVGIYLHHVPEIDIKSNTYLADFYLWFRWKGEIDPTETFEFTNQVDSWDTLKVPLYVDDEGEPKADVLDDGSRYQVYHIQTRFQHAFLLHDYPFDEQDIVIEIEDAEFQTDELLYVGDGPNQGYHPGLTIPGWEIRGVRSDVSVAHYATNFGDPRVQLGGDKYSHYAFQVHVARPVIAYLIKTILPIALVIMITFVVFFISSKYFEGRLGLAITSLISAVALQLTTSSDLPSVGYMVLLDKVYNISYLVIFLTLLESVIAARVADRGEEERSRRLDRISLFSLSVIFFGGITLVILLR